MVSRSKGPDTAKRRNLAPRMAPVAASTALVPVDPPRPQLMSPAERHRRRLANSRRPDPTADHVEELLARMCGGEIATEICDDAHMPQIGKLRRFIAGDGAMVRAYEAAQSALADTLMEEAKTYLRDATDSGDLETIRMAESYSKSMSAIVAQLAPKSHGTLVKLAGVADMPIAVQVINFASAVIK